MYDLINELQSGYLKSTNTAYMSKEKYIFVISQKLFILYIIYKFWMTQ